VRDQVAVELDRENVRARFQEMSGEDTETRSDFHDEVAEADSGDFDDPIDDLVLDQEILTEALAWTNT
jgi:hypothetical protein